MLRSRVNGHVVIVLCGKSDSYDDILTRDPRIWQKYDVTLVIDADHSLAKVFNVRAFPLLVIADEMGEIVEAGTAIAGVSYKQWASILPSCSGVSVQDVSGQHL